MSKIPADCICVQEKSWSMTGPPEQLKMVAEALDFYARAMNTELPKSLGDLCYNINAEYQTFNGLDQDDWDFTDEDKEELGIYQDDGDHD